jgi:hypothetical protein
MKKSMPGSHSLRMVEATAKQVSYVITDIFSRPGGWEERIKKQRTVASWAPYSKQGE